MNKKVFLLFALICMSGLITAGGLTFATHDDKVAELRDYKDEVSFDYDREVSHFQFVGDRECILIYETETSYCKSCFSYEVGGKVKQDCIKYLNSITDEEELRKAREKIIEENTPYQEPVNYEYIQTRG